VDFCIVTSPVIKRLSFWGCPSLRQACILTSFARMKIWVLLPV
jgi:hypothetical protein